MSHLLRYALAGVLYTFVLALAGCGDAGAPGSSGLPQQPAPQLGIPSMPAPTPGVSMPTLPPDNFDVEHPDKGASATYRVFFRDAVNEQSAGRWSVANNAGYKFWKLSNTCYSAPKAWTVGGNYWYNEDDELTSVGFDIPDGTDGIALSFYARWDVNAGDHTTVMFWDGTAWQQVIDHVDDQNPSYPAWDKYYFLLPANNSGMTQSCMLGFQLTSDGAGNSWGFGVDSVAVYQTQLGTPIGMIATDGDFAGQVDLDWDHVQVGNLLPDGYDIYRAPDDDGAPGTYAYLDSTTHPDSFYSDMTGDAGYYWYKVVATKAGWPDSPYSNEDSGWGTGTWNGVTVDSDNVVGQYSSLAKLANGNPAIAYHDGTNGDLRLAYCSQPDGSSGWNDVLVESEGFTGLYASLAIIDGKPAIACYDSNSTHLEYSYSSETDGSTGWTTVTVDSDPITGLWCSLKLVNGKPAISYSDSSNITLDYAYSSTADGSTGWSHLTVDGPTLGNNVTSLATLADGKPAIAYWDSTSGDLEYAYSSMADGSGGWTPVSVDTSGSVGTYASLALVNGYPGIAYLDDTNGDLKYAYSTQANGSSNWTTLVVDNSSTTYSYASLSVVYGKPAIAYLESLTGGVTDLKFAISTAPDGSGGWGYEVVEPTDTVGTDCSLAVINGKPGIACRDGVNNDVKFYWYE